MSNQYMLDEMWRQSDKSYIHPRDMHDKHIINAITKVVRQPLWIQSSQLYFLDVAKATRKDWDFMLSYKPELRKLVDEAVRRNLITIQPPATNMFPNSIAPLASITLRKDICRCFKCNSSDIGAYKSIWSEVLDRELERVQCNWCGASLLSKDVFRDWNSLYSSR